MWQCSKCKREFLKKKQVHSCVLYPLEKHFKNKGEIAKPLFKTLIKIIRSKIGPIKIESLPCCIHLVSHYTFGAVWAMKDKMRIDFRVDKKIKNFKVLKEVKMSRNRYLYYLDIKDKKEINKKLINLLKKSYHLSKFKS